MAVASGTLGLIVISNLLAVSLLRPVQLLAFYNKLIFFCQLFTVITRKALIKRNTSAKTQ